MRICRSLFKSRYLKNKKYSLSFFFHLWNLHQILKVFKQKKILIANVFAKLTTVSGFVPPLTIHCRLKTSFDSQHVKRLETRAKSSLGIFYHNFSSLWGEMTWKICPWLKFEIIGLFVNTWTADYNYPVPVCENFTVSYSNPVILKKKNIFWVFYSIYGISINFWTFSKKKEDRHSQCISEISDGPRLGHATIY